MQKDWNAKPFVELRHIPQGECSDVLGPEFESIFNVQWQGTNQGCFVPKQGSSTFGASQIPKDDKSDGFVSSGGEIYSLENNEMAS